ncbi:MAG: AAA-like domain-containing protein, partial [Halothece sp. Uz-M2-17]|nr:AAA-like domain-containing protein [Halothece sp. Uz-M2-17]
MTVDDAIALVDQLLQPEGLNDLQASVFRHCWQGKGYQEIADQLDYDPGYVRTVGSRLWQQLSHLLNKKVTKSNLHTVFQQYTSLVEPEQPISSSLDSSPIPEFPSLPLNFQSPFYIERSPIEQRCCQKILQPGALIRIQGPKYMGKTSLLYQVLGYARTQGYQTVRISCQEATTDSFSDLNTFLRWLCQTMARKLKLTPNLEPYWHEEPSFAKSNCTEYVEDYLIPEVNSPLVMGLDDVERIFAYPDIAQDFFPLLRLWHEEANETEIWQNLRLVVVHSTEVY